MGYRKLERKKKDPLNKRSVKDITTPGKITIENGGTSSFAFPCWYREIRWPKKAVHHCRSHHDHIGWPYPHHPDHSCQAWDFANSCCSLDRNVNCPPHPGNCRKLIDMSSVFPIHLRTEGYTDITVSFKDAPAGLTASAWIDEQDDWIIRVHFSAACEVAIEEPVKVMYAVFAKGTQGKHPIKDLVTKGVLVILPNPYE